jgi:hypothetical protein
MVDENKRRPIAKQKGDKPFFVLRSGQRSASPADVSKRIKGVI